MGEYEGAGEYSGGGDPDPAHDGTAGTAYDDVVNASGWIPSGPLSPFEGKDDDR